MFNKYALLIHGPFSTQWLTQIKINIDKFKKSFNQIVIVSYVNDFENYKKLVEELNFSQNIEFVTVKDVVNPGFFNINRQLICVNAGLKKIEAGSYVFKLRNDQSVDFNKILCHISNKIITTNCFTRVDRLYHPSDMFLSAPLEEMKLIYSMPLIEETHLMTEMHNQLLFEKNPDLKALPVSPEIMLCKNYLKHKNWNILETQEDSYKAIKTFYTVLNSWNIDYRWHKKRTNLCPEDYLVIPHYFTIAPFGGVPPEKASCYLQSDFNNKLPTPKDIFYLLLAKFVWFFWGNNIKYGIRKFGYLLLQLLPYFIVKKEVKRLKEKIRC